MTTVYWNAAFAQALNSYVTDGEVYKSILDEVVNVNSTQAFVGRFVDVLTKKLSKNSYVPFREKYGPGYLIVVIQYPFFDNNVLARLGSAWKAAGKVNVGCFRSVYLVHHVFGDENKKIRRWSYYSLPRGNERNTDIAADI